MTILEEQALRPVLEILAISDHEWRVCDGRYRPSDARRMLAYIERTPGGFELVRLQHPTGSERYGSLKDALDALVEPGDAVDV